MKRNLKKLGLGEELLDSLYALIDLPESEARDLLAKIGLMPDILEDLFPVVWAKKMVQNYIAKHKKQ